jgi:hypothetical protein
MTYSGPHRLADAAASTDAAVIAADSSHGEPPATGHGNVLRIVLWVVLGFSAIGNTVVSIIGAGTGSHLLFGAASALSALALGMRFLRAHR